jgi:hypothetical protein
MNRPSVKFVKAAEAAPRPIRREPEAPDRGEGWREAPEHRDGRLSEAPDAGEGRMSCLEHEFTHGRSQS